MGVLAEDCIGEIYMSEGCPRVWDDGIGKTKDRIKPRRKRKTIMLVQPLLKLKHLRGRICRQEQGKATRRQFEAIPGIKTWWKEGIPIAFLI